jgi:hypothetical protein
MLHSVAKVGYPPSLLLQSLDHSEINVRLPWPGPDAIVTTFLPDGVFHPIEGLIDLTNEEYHALTYLLSLTNAYRLGSISLAVYGASVLNFKTIFGFGDLMNKIANSHKFDSIYYGMLHNSDGWNAYDRGSHPGF